MSEPRRPMPHDHSHEEEHEHDLGLQHDVLTLQRKRLGRRNMLGLFGGLGAVGALAACSPSTGGGSAAPTPSSTPSPSASASASATARPSRRASSATPEPGSDIVPADAEIPAEMAGPFPADGSNGVNVLAEEGIVRRDISTSFGRASGTATGVPLTMRFRVYDLQGDEAVLMPGAALYAWHCDKDGAYSMYDGAAAGENYLRGVQVADEAGWVEFTTIFPGCYPGRWPHVHFEVYRSLDAALSASNILRTSQLAFPQDVSAAVYAGDGYEASVAPFEDISLESDMIFADGYSLQMARMSGSVADGYVATLNVPV